jgi:galactokinase
VQSLDLGEEAEFDLDQQYSGSTAHWVSYIEGVARELDQQGIAVPGANLVVASDVPRGSGLSSSAALEMSVARALVTLADAEVDLVQLAKVAQKAEHEYAGTKSGLMDQLTAAFGRRDHALLIDCRSLEAKPIELRLDGFTVVVCDTTVKHELAASAYNERRAECERGVELLRQKLPEIRALRDVSVAQFETYAYLLPEPIRRRCRHVVTENERTLRAAEALAQGQVQEVGALMVLSHQSLRDDYEVSSPELDIMVELAIRHEGVAGGRMTGGGFGGSTVNLVAVKVLDSFSESIARGYQERTGIAASIYVVEAADGVREITS